MWMTIITASSTDLLARLTSCLHSEFAMTDLGELHYFLGISVTRSDSGMFLCQKQYAADLLHRVGMSDCHSTTTPVDTQSKLSTTVGDPVADPTEYRSIAGALQYLTLTRPDISYAVQQACLHMHDPREPHLALVKRILQYVKGTISYGLHLHASSTTLIAYSDADWAGCPDSRRSTSGFCVYLGDNLDNLVSWSAKRQSTVSRSSAEAEYRAVAHVVAECCWIRQLLQELHLPLQSTTIVYCNNVKRGLHVC
uniref:Reverse transcriptase Ty1/copia-type domain-containing protein n=1 Tax=Arundo donax TaxID=35708 RepID=A0A0A9D390_ARUDO